MTDPAEVLLFSYGTLRQPEVQLATFGRLLEGREAAVPGFRLEWLTITDPAVIATSGSDLHPVLIPLAEPAADPDAETGAATDAVLGAVTDAGTGAVTDAGTGAATDAGTGAATDAGTGALTGAVTGTVFRITAAELDAADEYEVDDYVRVSVRLDTGEDAWVYVFAGDGDPA